MNPSLPLDWIPAASGAVLGRGDHLGLVMLVAALAYPILGLAARRSRQAKRTRERAKVDQEIAYVRPTIQGVAMARGATSYEIEYGRTKPLVTVTLVFPDGRLSATCRDDTHEEAALYALRLVVAAREAALADAARPAGKAAPADPSPPRGSRRGVIDEHTPWYEVLDVPSDAARKEIEKAFRLLAKRFHPDHGGSGEMMRHLTRARAEGVATR